MRKFKVSSLVLLLLLCTIPIAVLSFVPVNVPMGDPTGRVAAQTQLWTKTYGTVGRDEGVSIIPVSGGGFLMCGLTAPGVGTGRDAWLVRVDANGNQLWNQTYGRTTEHWETGADVIAVSGGGFAFCGGHARDVLPLPGTWDAWLVRVDANGNHLWNHTYGELEYLQVFSLVEVSSGGFAIAGYTDHNSAGLFDMWLLRVDANGNHLWNQTYGGIANDWGLDLVEVSGGGFALAGFTSSLGAGLQDMWLVRTDANGNHLWNTTYGGTGNDGANFLVELSGGGFALTGYTGSNSLGPSDGWLVRVDATGNHLWNQTYGGTAVEELDDVKELSGGNFIITGNTSSFGAGLFDLWLLRTDSSGTLLWNRTYGGTENDFGVTVVAISSNEFAALGTTQSSGAGLEDFYLVRVSDAPPFLPGIPPEWILIIAAVIIIVIIIVAIICYMRRR